MSASAVKLDTYSTAATGPVSSGLGGQRAGAEGHALAEGGEGEAAL
jgi:hypothetical protein